MKFGLPHPISTMSGNAGSAKTWFQSSTCAGVYQEKESLEESKRRKKDSLNQMPIMSGFCIC
jgi:hypothetical protein